MALRMLARNIIVRAPIAGGVLARGGSSLPILQQLPRALTTGTAQQFSRGVAWSRSFAVSAVSKSTDAELVSVLQEEITYEKENNEKAVKDLPPPEDWVLSEEPGDSVVTLTRKHNDEEVIVEFSVNNQAGEPMPAALVAAGDEEDEEPEIDLAVNFDATIVKGSKSLMFELASDGNYLQINHVDVGGAEEEVDEDAYDGPVFEELDEKLQRQFQEYLKERKIDASLGEYLIVVADTKEQSEYAKWLGEVKTFVEA